MYWLDNMAYLNTSLAAVDSMWGEMWVCGLIVCDIEWVAGWVCCQNESVAIITIIKYNTCIINRLRSQCIRGYHSKPGCIMTLLQFLSRQIDIQWITNIEHSTPDSQIDNHQPKYYKKRRQDTSQGNWSNYTMLNWFYLRNLVSTIAFTNCPSPNNTQQPAWAITL